MMEIVEFSKKDIIFIKDSFNNRKVSIRKLTEYFNCSEEHIKKVLSGQTESND